MLPIDKIIKEYNKLHIPPEVFNPCKMPLKRCKYFVLCSERSVGKTTNVLLFGMIAHKFGSQIIYIRQHADMITPKNARTLLDTIISFGYIEKVTDGVWHNVRYWAGGWYYCNYDDNGKVAEQDKKPFMVCLGLNQNEYIKSVGNYPNGNVIIFDEFISRYYQQDEFILFADVLKTVIRERHEPLVFMLGNTLDRYNQYFAEMELLGVTTSMPLGEHTEVVTSKGTPIYVEFITREKTKEKLTLNKLFFGFKNKKLGSITGDDWVIIPMQHIDSSDEREVIIKNLYVLYEGQLINLEVCYSEKYGTHICAHFATKTYDDSRIYSVDMMIDNRYRYRWGYDRLDKIVWGLYERKKFYYANNSVGVLIDKYASTCKHAKSLY